ncbi:MAG TPA: hypothetical protein VG166_15130 [Caulobacteraceae bacterium]|nr:hypothetical protein [Caulobacteraceae bacterium]
MTESPSTLVGHAIYLGDHRRDPDLAWALLGRIDTVAVAEGRLAPSGRLRSVEASEQVVIRAIDVREGHRPTPPAPAPTSPPPT